MKPDIVLALHGLQFMSAYMTPSIKLHTIGKRLNSKEILFWGGGTWMRGYNGFDTIEVNADPMKQYGYWEDAGMPNAA